MREVDFESNLVLILRCIGDIAHFVVACCPGVGRVKDGVLKGAVGVLKQSTESSIYFVHAKTKPHFLTKKGHQKSGIQCSVLIIIRPRRTNVRKLFTKGMCAYGV